MCFNDRTAGVEHALLDFEQRDIGAGMAGLSVTHVMTAPGALVATPATWRRKLKTGVRLEFPPSMHCAAPQLAREAGNDRGPMLVMTSEYGIDPKDREPSRLCWKSPPVEHWRDGAYA